MLEALSEYFEKSGIN